MVLSLVLAGAPSFAADVVQGANLLGMGTVGVAAPADNAAVTMNPGAIGLRKRFDLHVHGRVGPTAGLHWAATAVDARTSDVVAAGFAYSGDRFEPAVTAADLPAWSISGEEIRNRKRYHDFAGAIAVALLDRRISLGVGGALSVYDNDQQGSGRSFDMSAGLGVAPIDALTLGVSIRNFLPHARQDRPAQILAGIRVEDPTSFAIEVNASRGWLPAPTDLVAVAGLATAAEDPSVWTFSGGIDKRFGGVRVRAGGTWQGESRLPFATFGIGSHQDDGLGFEYGLAVPLTSDLRFSSTVHQISFRFAAEAEIDPND